MPSGFGSGFWLAFPAEDSAELELGVSRGEESGAPVVSTGSSRFREPASRKAADSAELELGVSRGEESGAPVVSTGSSRFSSKNRPPVRQQTVLSWSSAFPGARNLELRSSRPALPGSENRPPVRQQTVLSWSSAFPGGELWSSGRPDRLFPVQRTGLQEGRNNAQGAATGQLPRNVFWSTSSSNALTKSS